MKVETYNLYLNGHYVRKATRVILSNGRVIEFMERLSNKEAGRQVKRMRSKDDGNDNLRSKMSQIFLWLPPHTSAWVNANTGELKIREPYKVIDLTFS